MNTPSLELLDTSRTGLSSDSILDWLVKCPKLTEISIRSSFPLENLFSGTIPSEIGTLTLLSTLDLRSNNFTGTIPVELGKVTSLQYLRLSSNGFAGSLPDGLFTSLRSLVEFSYEEIPGHDGTLPKELFSLPVILSIELVSSQFSGTLPDVNTPLLQVLNVGNNNFTGTIPTMDSATNLVRLLLRGNMLEGTIPPLDGCPYLVDFHASGNKLSGDFCSLERNSRLQEILLSENSLDGSLCVFDQPVPSLISLILSDNQLSGTIPTTFFAPLVNTEFIYMDENNFVGTVPESMNALPRLVSIDLSSNRLTGTIPSLAVSLDLLHAIFHGNLFSDCAFACSSPNAILSVGDNDLRTFPISADCLHSPKVIYGRSNKIEGVFNLSLLQDTEEAYFQDNLFASVELDPDLSIKLENLNLSNCRITETPPHLLANAPELEELDLSNNQIAEFDLGVSGSSLELLNLRSNSLSGTFLSAAHFEKLEEIDVSLNSLSGPFPQDWGANVKVVRVSDNMFRGGIPANVPGDQVQVFDVSMNEMSGYVPYWVCTADSADISGNDFYCPLPDCCGVGSVTCGTTCVDPPVDIVDYPWKIVYIVVGCLLLVGLLAAVALTKTRLGKDVERMVGYGSLLYAGATRSIIITDITILDILGGGTSGVVYRGLWQGHTQVALKRMPGKKQVKAFEAEARLLLGVRHPNIVQFLGIFTSDNGQKYLVSELVKLGSLENVLHKNTGMSVEQLMALARDIAAGLDYLHKSGIIHRDLATRNILVKDDGTHLTPKIADLGMSKRVVKSGVYESLYDTGECLPFRSLAPEVFTSRIFSYCSDMFAYGVTVWELFNDAAVPWQGYGLNEVRDNAIAGRPLPRVGMITEKIYTGVLVKCAAADPTERPTAYEAFSWFEEELQERFHRSQSRYSPAESTVDDHDVSYEVPSDVEDPTDDGLYLYCTRVWS
mmetsp:Transcript_13162/g.37357  ORF Transcript_13162/g.37357 Transcript_13162/m.37357 type:complete len:947 (+) Transcript_13162:778-3618(+)